MLGMVTSMIQLMTALDTKGCAKKSDRHGFENFVADKDNQSLFRMLDLDEILELHVPSREASLWSYVSPMFMTFSAGGNDDVGPDTSNSGTISSDSGAIIAQISIIAIITALSVFADYKVF